MSFLRLLREMEAKNNDLFTDSDGREWAFVDDGTACAISCTVGKIKIKLTQEQLEACGAPNGFRKRLSRAEEYAYELDKLQNTVLEGLEALKRHASALEEKK